MTSVETCYEPTTKRATSIVHKVRGNSAGVWHGVEESRVFWLLLICVGIRRMLVDGAGQLWYMASHTGHNSSLSQISRIKDSFRRGS